MDTKYNKNINQREANMKNKKRKPPLVPQIIKNNSEIAVVANDFHYPFQDNRVVKLWMSFLNDIQPDTVIINGDLLDCFALSKFDKDPKRQIRIEEEIAMGRNFFVKIREMLPKAHLVYIYGNHEFRFQTYLIRNAPDLRNLKGLSLEDQMELGGLDVTIVNSGLKESYYKFGGLYIAHFNKVSQHGGYTAKQLVDAKGVSVLQGHTHRVGSSLRSYLNGNVLGGWDNGCMCDLHPQYVLDPNWLHCFSVVYKEDKDNRFMVVQVPIIKYKFRFGGTLYSG